MRIPRTAKIRATPHMLDEYEQRKGQFDGALALAGELWAKIAESLSLCGDTGPFDPSDFMIGIIDEDVIIRSPMLSHTKSVDGYSPTYYPMYLIENLHDMRTSFDTKRYRTPESLYVFVELATRAAMRLGLEGTFSMGFGSGYGYARTGWIAEKARQAEVRAFYEMFFPSSLYLGKKDRYDWDFHWTSVQERLKEIFDKFAAWQDDPDLYGAEVTPDHKTIPMMV